MRNIFFLALCCTLAACGPGKTDTVEETIADTTTVPGKSYTADLVTATPIQIDSSEYFMYPMPNGHPEKDEEGGSFLSKDVPNLTYWNVAFYNTLTKKIHLLSDRKMVINSYNAAYSRYDSSSSYEYPSSDSPNERNRVNASQEDGHIFYSIIVDDYNKDNKLDRKDPTYLFMSDNQGNNLKQISPAGTNVRSWELIKNSGVVLMQTQRDSTYDGEAIIVPEVPYAYDLKKGGAPELVFNTEFGTMVNKLYKKQWPVKKKN
ncbi:hypothetical protein [Mucilaginibacter pedocola]|uniref:Lipoprotein n=1 Tax=Mucilaginibacter pedocola TaxID=1792845 RepID=A0A1S9PAX3_9SPHI|nr:hypothetical protein [Mucilaginibacter pedocola]OOQ58122.1 hypothetical protein BC343_10750 [Mucilaginibacter pedocola]